MSIRVSIPTNQITHVIYQIGNVPVLENLLSIEALLYQEYEGRLTCLFSYDIERDIGFHIPSPYGFEPSNDQLPPKRTGLNMSNQKEVREYIQQIKSRITDITNRCRNDPFYSQTINCIGGKYKRIDCNANDSPSTIIEQYETLFDNVKQWSLKPMFPDRRVDYQEYSRLEKLHREDQHQHGVYGIHDVYGIYDIFGDIEYQMGDNQYSPPIWSYNDRMSEAQKVVGVIGSMTPYSGCLCFKINPRVGYQLLNIPAFLQDINRDYMHVDGFMGFEYIVRDEIKLLILEYSSYC